MTDTRSHPPASDPDPAPLRDATAPAPALSDQLATVRENLADARARLAILEQQSQARIQSEDARFAALQQQVEHIGERLDQQDQLAAAGQQQVKSQLGTVQQQLGVLVAEKAAAQEARDEQRKTARATFRTLLLALPTATWPLTEGHPFALRAIIFGACVGLAVAFIAHDHFRAPPAATSATTQVR